MDAAEQQYVKGFNNGFLLAEHAPGLVQKLVPGLQTVNDYTDGLIAGSQQYTLDREQDGLTELSRLRNISREREERDLG